MSLLVHGLLRAEPAAAIDLDALSERLGADIRFVAHEGIAALVSETAGGEPLPSRQNLLTHAGILEAAAERDTVLPMRFGVVAPDGEALVSTFLAPQQASLLARIERLRGHAELRMRGTYDEETIVAEVLEGDRRAARLRGRESFDARVELGERISAGIERRRDRDAAHAVETLRPYITDAAAGEVSEPLDAFAVSFLVAEERLPDFDRAVEQLGADLTPRVQLELVGPLPPFSFAATGAV